MKHFKEKSKIFLLRLELPLHYLNDEERQDLRKYGKMQEGLIREILVPGDMTLHALHYLIQKLYGWQNSHLHHFSLPDAMFQIMTGGQNESAEQGCTDYDGKFMNWAKLCGVYFRYPSENYDDIYWDDNYMDGQNFAVWLRKRYIGPYRYGGTGEHYTAAHRQVKTLIRTNPELQLIIPFSEWHTLKKAGKLTDENQRYTVAIDQVSIREMNDFLETNLNELLERLTLQELLTQECAFHTSHMKEIMNFLAENQEKVTEDLNTLPITDMLHYQYDYGDSWEISITLKASYDPTELSQIPAEWQESAATVSEKEKPVLVMADGLPLMDDVGGIHGYAEFLKTIHESEDPDQIRQLKSWARWMGWTGRMSSRL